MWLSSDIGGGGLIGHKCLILNAHLTNVLCFHFPSSSIQ